MLLNSERIRFVGTIRIVVRGLVSRQLFTGRTAEAVMAERKTSRLSLQRTHSLQ